MATKENKILQTIKAMIKKEVKSFLQENLEPLIKNKVNEILAEHFLQSLKGKPSLMETVMPQQTNSSTSTANAAESYRREREERERAQQQQRDAMRRKIVDDMPSDMQMIFEDTDPVSYHANDDDDEGIDPSIFLNRGR